MAKTQVTSKSVKRVTKGRATVQSDLVAVEEPLQILLEHGQAHARRETALAITMRTPGNDLDLVRGFLHAEGVVRRSEDIVRLRHCVRAETPDNVVRASLHPDVALPAWLTERRMPMTGACGVCGEATIESLTARGIVPVPFGSSRLSVASVGRALRALDGSQPSFRHTGGTHGAALFRFDGELVLAREDIGRHNALDKLVGAWLSRAGGAASEHFIVVSSRASFELVQKTASASFPILVAVGAASSLAIETALEFGLTLVGFARDNRFNVYACSERIRTETVAPFEVVVAAGV